MATPALSQNTSRLILPRLAAVCAQDVVNRDCRFVLTYTARVWGRSLGCLEFSGIDVRYRRRGEGVIARRIVSYSLALACAVPIVIVSAVSAQSVDNRDSEVYNSKRSLFERPKTIYRRGIIGQHKSDPSVDSRANSIGRTGPPECQLPSVGRHRGVPYELPPSEAYDTHGFELGITQS